MYHNDRLSGGHKRTASVIRSLNELDESLESIDFEGGYVFQQTLDALPYIVQEAISKELIPNILFILGVVLFCTLLLMGDWKPSCIVFLTVLDTIINIGGRTMFTMLLAGIDIYIIQNKIQNISL